MTQYTDSYSSCSADIQNIVANDIGLMEEYFLCQTGQYEWTALINTVGVNKTRSIVITRNTTSGYGNNIYTVTRTDDVEWSCNFTNEYYCYSNMGYGKSLDLPIHTTMTTYALMLISCMLMLAVVFKGALFRCLDKR